MEECIGETLCVSGALPERAEVFARVPGPRPNGFLQPTVTKFSTSEAEVTVRRTATGEIRVYLLEGASPGMDTLPGRVDKEGFESANQAGQVAAPAVVPLRQGGAPASATLPQLEDPEPPAGPWLTTPALPGFRAKVRITAGGNAIAGQKAPACIAETLCVSGALPGRAEVFVRVVGPKPNGKLWPTLARFSTSRIEVWIQQTGSREIAYYDMPAVTPGARFLRIDGLFDRDRFDPL